MEMNGFMINNVRLRVHRAKVFNFIFLNVMVYKLFHMQVPVTKGRWAGGGGRGRRNDNEILPPPPEEAGVAPSQNVNPPPVIPEGILNNLIIACIVIILILIILSAEVRTVEYNPNKFVPKIPKMTITAELQEHYPLFTLNLLFVKRTDYYLSLI